MKEWEKFQNDFNNMSDKDIADETRRMTYQLDEAEEWIEAVCAWKSAGSPRTSNAK